jgi:hypothetical protein
MKILVVDSVAAACSSLAHGLKEALGNETLCASSAAEALCWFQVERDSIGVVIFFLETDPNSGFSFIRKIQDFCQAMTIRRPRFLVLTPGPLTAGFDSRFRTIGAECILYGFAQQLYATARRLIFEAICENKKTTILVDRTGLESKFLVVGPARPELISCGHRLLPMMNCFAINFGTELSTLDLADAAEIAIASVRVYLSRLRARYDEARMKVGVDVPGREVFCTRRKDGAFVHILRARVLFN